MACLKSWRRWFDRNAPAQTQTRHLGRAIVRADNTVPITQGSLHGWFVAHASRGDSPDSQAAEKQKTAGLRYRRDVIDEALKSTNARKVTEGPIAEQICIGTN